MRVLLADDQHEVRSGLKLLLEQESDCHVVGEAADLTDLLVQAQKMRPDVVLLDWELPSIRATDLVPVLRRLCPGLHIVALSGRPEVRKATLNAGADAFISKGDQPERVLTALRAVAKRDDHG